MYTTTNSSDIEMSRALQDALAEYRMYETGYAFAFNELSFNQMLGQVMVLGNISDLFTYEIEGPEIDGLTLTRFVFQILKRGTPIASMSARYEPDTFGISFEFSVMNKVTKAEAIIGKLDTLTMQPDAAHNELDLKPEVMGAGFVERMVVSLLTCINEEHRN